jgi:hypothetical protein
MMDEQLFFEHELKHMKLFLNTADGPLKHVNEKYVLWKGYRAKTIMVGPERYFETEQRYEI